MKLALNSVLLLTMFVLVGCDHSTNNQPPPPGAQLAITNPINDDVVNGTVPVSVNTKGMGKVTKIELYVNGQLAQARNAPPWQFDWQTTDLQSNSYHTLYTKAYALGSGYSVSQAVTVRIK